MVENKKTNKKTIIFQSAEMKDFCDALVQIQSKKTGISIMRLIENAIIHEFGFRDYRYNDWFRHYCEESATASYFSLFQLLSEPNVIFRFYKMLCHYGNIDLKNDSIYKHPTVVQFLSTNAPHLGNQNVSDEKMIERIFLLLNRHDLEPIFYDYLYCYSHLLDKNPIPIEKLVYLLLPSDKRVEGACHE